MGWSRRGVERDRNLSQMMVMFLVWMANVANLWERYNYWSLLCQNFINNWFRCSLLIFLSLCKCSQTLHPFFSCADSITTRSSSDSHIVCSKNIWWVKGITTSFQFLTMEFQNFSKTLFFIIHPHKKR